jgi:hypothetical protein
VPSVPSEAHEDRVPIDLTFEGKSLWMVLHLEKAVSLAGLRVEEARGSSIVVLSMAIQGDFAGLADRDGGSLDEDAREAWARGQLVERIDAQIAGLQAHYETLDFETIDLDRDEAGDRALFDPSIRVGGEPRVLQGAQGIPPGRARGRRSGRVGTGSGPGSGSRDCPASRAVGFV